MSEYDLQFQADLEKAQALSLETLALEQFRRQKLNADSVRVAGAGAGSARRSPPPALPPPPRKPPRVRSNSDAPRSSGGSPAPDDSSDLISFSSPTSKTAPQDAHASLKEFINKLGQQTEELTLTTPDQSPVAMKNQNYHQRPGYPYPPPYQLPPATPYSYPPYSPMPMPYSPATTPYPPATPYIPSPLPSYPYYTPPVDQNPQNPYIPASPVYPTIPFSQTRMASPSPYVGYPPPQVAPPYNYATTNMISRPTRPLYPQLSQMNQVNQVSQLNQVNQMTVNQLGQVNQSQSNNNNNNNTQVVMRNDPSRNSVESNTSRKSSEVSIGSNESADSVGSLPRSLNLIDFGRQRAGTGAGTGAGAGSVRVSVLQAFDPLLTEQASPEYASAKSECSSSVYEEYDPLDFLYGETELRETPVYATVNKRESAALPSPPPKAMPSVPAVPIRNTTNKLYDCIVKIRTRNYDSEHKAFLKMVLDVRKKFVYSDEKSNPGHVVATRSGGRYPPHTSIKLVVHHQHAPHPITFTADVESTVEHVILTVVCSLDEDIRDDMSGYMLRVWGANEYLTPGSSLSEYDYVRECVRLEKDVRLCLHEGRDVSLARTERDDARAAHLTLDDLIPSQGAVMLSFDKLSILLQTLEHELARAVGDTRADGHCSPQGVFQAVKAICALAGGVETLHVTHALTGFAQATQPDQSNSGLVTPEIQSDNGPYCSVSLRCATPQERVAHQCSRVRDAVRALVALYSRTRLLDFQLTEPHYLTPSNPEKAVPSHSVSETTLFRIEAVHSLPLSWSHDEYLFHAQVYYGTRPLKPPRVTQSSRIECAGFYPRIIFDIWLNLEDLPLNTLPREARLVLTLYGRTEKPDDQHQDNQPPSETREESHDVKYEQVELGWAAVQLFDYDGMFASGNYVLPLWGASCGRVIGPAPHPTHAPPPPYPQVNIEFLPYAPAGVAWSSGAGGGRPRAPPALPAFDSLDGHTQQQLLHLIEQGAYQVMPTPCREVMWEKRQYLVELPGALPLVLLAATHWYGDHRESLVALMELWQKPSPLNAMHLLLPCFPDAAVRETAVQLVDQLPDDELCRVLPQLAQALRHDTYEPSPLAGMLLSRALAAPAVAHKLFWLLVHSLPNVPQAPSQEFLGITLEESSGGAPAPACAAAAWRYRLVLRALLAVCGENLTSTLMRQQLLVQNLSEVALSVKSAKEALRQRALSAGGEKLAGILRSRPAALPLALGKYVHDVDIKSCTYFASNTLPLKINFIGNDNAVVPAMFKVGDDLRQDALVLQVMKVMDSLWLKAGLDLRMVTFQALPTSHRRGMIEIVSEAETLRAIQTEWGLTGSFKDKPIAEWLAKHNPSELEYQRARDNFTASCAGYSVATFLLGICDRHNDNIMLKTSGHLFHIDFGKFLGDTQKFYNFKRDRAPFVLTHDMVYVINGGERPTQRFQHFVELCCCAFNIVRAQNQHILDLFALMAMSGVPGVTSDAVHYVRSALLPGATNAEAAAAFARLIHSSLKSKFTPINFFLHNLAQLRASGDQGTNTSELLSFMPRTYTMAQEGRLASVECLGYEKRYDPEKHYVYALRVYRQGQATPAVLYRSYRHFTELYQKICLHFPLAKVHSLPGGLHVGRSNTRQVAERRFPDVQAFLTSLFELADEIAHSDLVYTFFHPLLRDQQDVEPQRLKHRESTEESSSSGGGSLKLSVQYAGGVLSVLILHAQSLALAPQGHPPNPYVKVYLVPDPTKETKRKTRVLKRNSHPSFMEMLEYRLPLDVVRARSLQATVWHYDSLQENQFLGGVVIPLDSLPLREETVAWYPLEYIPR